VFATREYGSTELKVSELLGLSDLTGHEIWMVAGPRREGVHPGGIERLLSLFHALRFSSNQLPSLLRLLTPDSTQKAAAEISPFLADKEVERLTLIFLEPDKQALSPRGIALGLEGAVRGCRGTGGCPEGGSLDCCLRLRERHFV
jgi:hypothetical protein